MPKFLILIFIMSTFSSTGQGLKLSVLDSSHYFDFWEGTWMATWKEGDKLGKGTNELTWVMDGKVLQENFQILEG